MKLQGVSMALFMGIALGSNKKLYDPPKFFNDGSFDMKEIDKKRKKNKRKKITHENKTRG